MHQENLRQELLTEALKDIPFDGWSFKVVENAAFRLFNNKAYSEIAFPEGVKDLISYFIDNINKELEEKIKATDLTKLKVREKIFLIVKTRLELLKHHKIIIQKLLSYLSMPQNISFSTKLLWCTADQIWYLADDKSVDYNYYTKRTILAGVYSSTILYFISDSSENNEQTWEFLSRRIEDALKIGNIKKCKDNVLDIAKKIPFVRMAFYKD